MSDETNSLPAGGEALPAAAPKSDAEAAQREQASESTPEQKAAAEKADAEKQEGERKKNRTKAYIERLNEENRQLRAWRAEQEARSQQAPPQQRAPQQSQQQADTGPTLEQFNYDLTAFQQARDQWVIGQAEKRWTESQKQQAAQAREQTTWQTYESKAAEFADAHPDFLEVVGSIQYPITDAAQAAIAAHDIGPQIAYHLGTNDDDAYELARTPPHLADAAVRRLASRLSAAQQQDPPAAVAPTNPKPLSRTPPPAPMVSGRAAADIPAEKLTDEQWLAKERAKRKR